MPMFLLPTLVNRFSFSFHCTPCPFARTKAMTDTFLLYSCRSKAKYFTRKQHDTFFVHAPAPWPYGNSLLSTRLLLRSVVVVVLLPLIHRWTESCRNPLSGTDSCLDAAAAVVAAASLVAVVAVASLAAAFVARPCGPDPLLSASSKRHQKHPVWEIKSR